MCVAHIYGRANGALGLHSAAAAVELENVLASMPLRVWRSDQVVPLSEHPNDPPASRAFAAMEFLTTFEVTFPDSAGEQEVAEMKAREADRSHELAEQGHLVRLWSLPPTPGRWRALGLWRAEDADELPVALKSLPMVPWMATETTPATEHPNDPASAEAESRELSDPGSTRVLPGRARATRLARVGADTFR